MVTFDFGSEGQLAHLQFGDVVAIKYIDWTAANEADITESGVLVRMTDSPWLAEIRSFREAVLVKKVALSKDELLHFHIYFDDMGSLDVVASTFRSVDRLECAG